MPRLLIVATFVCVLAASACAAVESSLSFDFNAANPWPDASTLSSSPSIVTEAAWLPVGTIDEAGTTTATGALQLTVNSEKAPTSWGAAVVSGPLRVATRETDLRKLTLGFMLSSSAALPVLVRIESCNTQGKVNGALQGVIYPAAADFYQRYSLDLSTLTQIGNGRFNPGDPAIKLTFGIQRTADGRGWPANPAHRLRIDNVSYAGLAYYVSPGGRDYHDGRTEATAFATPQAALDVAQPGDIILLRQGTYDGGDESTASFVRAGTPAAWITLKNYPGENPVLTGNGWNIVNLKYGSKSSPDSDHTLAYLEIRGLHIRGTGDTTQAKSPSSIGLPEAASNSNGIAIDGRYMTHVPHHLRVADCLVDYCPGAGISELESDWITFENNVSRCNCWHTIYATSGFSLLGASNFDTTQNTYKILVRNNVAYGNETRQKWASLARYSDGNGIIIDVNQQTTDRPDGTYLGRTLVTGNLCYDNGGSGIHIVRAKHVDILNNTAYLNSASPHLEYSQIYAYGSQDIRIMNNILVAPVANIAAGEPPEPVNELKGPDNDVTFARNLYFGGNIPPALGEGDRIGDPLFVKASRDPKVADFHLKPGSPAIDTGIETGAKDAPPLPLIDLDGNLRPQGSAIDLGAYEFGAKR